MLYIIYSGKFFKVSNKKNCDIAILKEIKFQQNKTKCHFCLRDLKVTFHKNSVVVPNFPRLSF